MLDFVEYMARDDLEIFGREQFTQKIIRSIREYFSEPGVEVSTFGSDATGLGLPTSDIDIMINAPSLYNPNPYMARELKIRVLYDLQQHFLSNCIFVKSTVRDEAHIPILEMEDLETGLEVDISFEEPYSKHALNDVQQWNMKYGHQELIPLILLIKHSLNMRKLGLGSATMPYQVKPARQ
jgi:DNA polymerase sigma